MFNTSSVLARGLVALSGTDAEKQLAELLYDDNLQVISSLELNQMASYTYHERPLVAGQKDLCEKILDMLEAALSKPLDHSTLTLHKALVVLQHVLIYGAEKVTTAAVYLGAYVEPLMQYNTAILAQQSGSMTGMLLRFKGGAVDKGGPVREVATKVHQLVSNRQQLLYERSVKADPRSLVPVGERNRAAFATDEARHAALQKRMEQERQMRLQSNLAKSSSAFGSGYTGRDGKSVVGAAHGLDEMIKQAQKEQQKFSDEQQQGYRPPGSDAVAAAQAAQAAANIQDLLSLDETGTTSSSQYQPHSSLPQQSVDLLDFGGSSNDAAAAPAPSYEADLLGAASAWPAAPTSNGVGGGSATMDIFRNAAAPPTITPSAASDPFAFAAPPPHTVPTGPALTTTTTPGNAYQLPTAPALSTNLPGSTTLTPAPPPATMEPPSEDRFAALDALAGSSSSTAGAGLAAAAPMLGSYVPSSTAMPPSIAANTSSIQVSQMSRIPGTSGMHNDDNGDENGFVMGGAVGAGLQPLGPAPAAPPPPPPPGSGW